jgi:hypothetical protein
MDRWPHQQLGRKTSGDNCTVKVIKNYYIEAVIQTLISSKQAQKRHEWINPNSHGVGHIGHTHF